MTHGNLFDLEEARWSGKRDQSYSEHPTRGDWNAFDAMIGSISWAGRQEFVKSRANIISRAW